MNNYDIIIVGASTTGSWTGKKLAQKGFKVLIIEKQEKENISRAYDIFHMGKKEMKKFDLTIPQPGDTDYAFVFTGGMAYSAYGNYPKPSYSEVIGMHKHDYIMRMHSEAIAAGAEIVYGAPFEDFIYDDNGRIIGITYGGGKQAYAKIVADCSGIPSVARRKLPDGYGVENFEIGPRDMFYVILYYVKYPEGHKKIRNTDSYLQYKAWSAPQADPDGGILGVGANLSFDYAEEMFKQFNKNVPLGDYEIQRIEKGATPYLRTPYSFVADGFVAMGDAACLTKPFNGEGCTSALVQAQIVVDVVSDILRHGGYATQSRLWRINKEYNDCQGKSFAFLRAVLTGAASMNCEENEYFFAHDIVFSQKTFAGLENGINFTPKEIAHMLHYIAQGMARGKITTATMKKLASALANGVEINSLYSDYPTYPENFDEWCKKADILWKKIGSMADNCDPEIIAKIESRKEKEKA